jgi:hypothetical protein
MKSFLFAGALLALSPVLAHADGAKVCFEAETPDKIESPLRKMMNKDARASGKGFLEIPWDQNKTKGIGSATYTFNAPKAGVYTLWARCYWANGCGNSILAGVDGSDSKILGEDGQYDSWHWVGGRARVKLNAGKNTLVLHNRETGVRVDQFFLTQDSEYIPQGPRKVTK